MWAAWIVYNEQSIVFHHPASCTLIKIAFEAATCQKILQLIWVAVSELRNLAAMEDWADSRVLRTKF